MGEKKVRRSKHSEKVAELTNDLKRVQAEFENYKKRVEKEKGMFTEYAEARVVERLLPFVESFESAVENLGESKDLDREKLLEGLGLIKKQFDDFLGKEGLKEVDCLGKQFDPMVCEVLMEGQDKGKEDGVVLEVLQKGYLLKGKLLRPAKVKVNKKGDVNG